MYDLFDPSNLNDFQSSKQDGVIWDYEQLFQVCSRLRTCDLQNSSAPHFPSKAGSAICPALTNMKFTQKELYIRPGRYEGGSLFSVSVRW